jgi:methionyl-tRNA formyltransferase
MLSILYFGMAGAFSAPPLAALLDAGFDVRAVVLPAFDAGSSGTPAIAMTRRPAPAARGRRALPLLGAAAEPNIVELAALRDLPVLEVARMRDPAVVETLAAYKPDAICVACFSRRIPAAVLRLPRLGCLNLHPSLLPDNRGPDPLFWTFCRGDEEAGVTIHLMDDGLDSGPIVLQETIPMPDGVSEAWLEGECARRGGRLLVRALAGLNDGTLHPVAQDSARATAYTWPQPDDYVITPERSARWAFNFASSIGARAQPIRIDTPGGTFRLVAPLGYDVSAPKAQRLVLDDNELWLRCCSGVFHATVAPWE